jgi:hypothetical protein
LPNTSSRRSFILVRNTFSLHPDPSDERLIFFYNGVEIFSAYDLSARHLPLVGTGPKTIARMLNSKVGPSRLYFIGIIVAVSKENTRRDKASIRAAMSIDKIRIK